MAAVTRVLVVDDSPMFTAVIGAILEGDDDLSVVGVCSDGRQAVRMTEALRPDVIIMDLHMPVMNGLTAVEQIMATRPTPILILTADPGAQTGELTFEALRRGALDLMAKPEGPEVSYRCKEALREHVRLLAGVTVVRHLAGNRHRWRFEQEGTPTPMPLPRVVAAPARSAAVLDVRPPPAVAPEVRHPGGRHPAARVVAMAASTGGPAVLAQILEALPRGFPAGVAIVQHIAPGFAACLARWLDDVSPLRVQVAEHGSLLSAGLVMLAPEGHHLTLTRGGRAALDRSPSVDGYRPSGTRLLDSVARCCGAGAVGVILSGMGRDGVTGLQAILNAGGLTMAQEQASCVVYGMPQVAVQTGAAQLVLTPEQLPGALCRAVGLSSFERGSPTKAVLR